MLCTCNNTDHNKRVMFSGINRCTMMILYIVLQVQPKSTTLPSLRDHKWDTRLDCKKYGLPTHQHHGTSATRGNDLKYDLTTYCSWFFILKTVWGREGGMADRKSPHSVLSIYHAIAEPHSSEIITSTWQPVMSQPDRYHWMSLW